jgi:hypothetical protein
MQAIPPGYPLLNSIFANVEKWVRSIYLAFVSFSSPRASSLYKTTAEFRPDKYFNNAFAASCDFAF